MRLPHDVREEAYARVLASADWPVKALKLADIYDNLGDAQHLSPGARRRTAAKTRFYLDALRTGLPAQVQPALQLVEERLAQLELSLTS
jgi:hypothetical protein